ncbi:MAG: hypothetical protein MUE85_12205 [Microscillaceae bacterium]|jgi:hypothetical protein|nr:hypothetical protein [Microscillaceae bacterium]
MKDTQKLVFNVPNTLKIKVLDEVTNRRKQSARRFTQTDLIIELLENYFKEPKTQSN